MKLFLYHAKQKIWLFIGFVIPYFLLLFLQNPDGFGFYHQITEEYPSLLIALLSAFVLTSDTEIEFAKCYGISFAKLGFAHWLPNFIYPFIIAIVTCLIYWELHTAALLHDGSVLQPQYGVMMFSLFVTFLIVTSFTLFIRVLIRNMYATLGAFLIAFTPFHTLHANLLMKKIPISMAKYDIWITGLLYSDAYDVSMETWLRNRFACLGIAILFMIMAFLLLKQKNYENIR